MNEKIRGDILDILGHTIDIFSKKLPKDIVKLRDLSDHTTHNSSIYQDEDSINIAILILALSKIVEKKQDKIDYTKFYHLLIQAKQTLEENNIKLFRTTIKHLIKELKDLDTGVESYIKSQISKGTRLYEHGISAAKASEILGISQWQLLSYAGKSEVLEKTLISGSIRKRLNKARKIFK